MFTSAFSILHVLLYVFFLLPVAWDNHHVWASGTLKNITVDDNSSFVVYTGNWQVSIPLVDLDYGGYHHWSNDRNAKALVAFSGVAIYFLAPKWPYKVGVLLSVDNGPKTQVDLVDPNGVSVNGLETINSSVVWGISGLDGGKDVNHLLTVEFPLPTDVEAMVFDGIIYTVEDDSAPPASPSDSSNSSPSNTASVPNEQTSSPSATGSTNATNSSKKQDMTIGIGVGVGGGLVLILGGLVLYVLYRKGLFGADGREKGGGEKVRMVGETAEGGYRHSSTPFSENMEGGGAPTTVNGHGDYHETVMTYEPGIGETTRTSLSWSPPREVTPINSTPFDHRTNVASSTGLFPRPHSGPIGQNERSAQNNGDPEKPPPSYYKS